MSIISIIDRITTDAMHFEAHKMSDHSKIYCDAKRIEPFTVILTVGDQWAANISRSDPAMFAIEGNEIIIPPLTSIVLEVEETLMMPFNVYGTVTQKGSAFLEEGLMLSAGKVDPSFVGKLQVLIFNSTKTAKTLNRGEDIGNLLFFRTDKTLQSTMFNGVQEARIKKRTRFEKFKAFFLSDPKFTLNLIASILTSSLVAAILTIYISGKVIKSDEGNIKPKIEQKVNK